MSAGPEGARISALSAVIASEAMQFILSATLGFGFAINRPHGRGRA